MGREDRRHHAGFAHDMDQSDGASLFYTTPSPATLQVLRQYALHLLFMPQAPLSTTASTSETPASVRNPFPFQHKPNTLDRDHIVVPAGWDSWGKITVLRDGFDAKLWGEAWVQDLEAEDNDEGSGAKGLYATLVPDQGPKPTPLPSFNNPIPEQAFLAKNYDENSKKQDRDPRGAFRNPADLAGAAAGIVGPLGSSSFNLPNVERALSELELGISGGGAVNSSEATRRLAARGVTATGRPAGPATSASQAIPIGRTPSSPQQNTGGSSPTAGQTQHEVLQNFFQSLLSSKDRAGAATGTRGTGAPKTNGGVNGTEEGSS